MSLRRYISVSLFLCIYFYGYGQDSLETKLVCEKCDEDVSRLIGKRREAGIQDLLFQLQAYGYFEADADTLSGGSGLSVRLKPGRRYRWAQLDLKGFPEKLLEKTPKAPLSAGDAFKYETLAKFAAAAVRYSENNGYPFAALDFDSASIAGDKIYGRLSYEPGPEIRFDTLKIYGSPQLSPVFLGAFLNIQPGRLYDQARVDDAASQIERLPFLQFVKSETTFQNETAIVRLHLDYTPANRFEGALGLAPNEAAGDGLLVTGQVDLRLSNLFRSAKSLSLKWQSLRPASQFLELHYAHPNVLLSPLNLGLDFDLLKEDSAYLTRNFAIRAGYFVNPETDLNFITQYNSVNTLNSPALDNPDLSDYKWLSYGASLDWRRLDNLLIPKKGSAFFVEGLAGNKTIENLNRKSVQVQLRARLNNYLPVNARMVLFSGLSYGAVRSDDLFVSDLFRVGGLGDLRGFTDNELFASQYALSNLELRYFFERRSYFLVLYDQAYLANSLTGFGDYPSGLGAGLALKANAGLLKIVYALGRDSGRAFDLNYSKFHFGFEALF